LPETPAVLLGPDAGPGAALVLQPVPDGLPRLCWVGPARPGLDPEGVAATVGVAGPAESPHGNTSRAVPLLTSAADGWLGRPGLAGHRQGTGAGWAPSFTGADVETVPGAVRVSARAAEAGLELRTEAESVPGGLLRLRHTLTNAGADPYVLDWLEVTVPLPDRAAETLDLTGRWALERQPQRRPVQDGVWLRESRGGRPGHGAATQLVAGTPGFGFGAGEVWAAHVGWSGNSRLFVERQPSGLVTLGGGELLLPGELMLAPGAGYSTPWLYLAASLDGLDGIAGQFHGYLRAQPASPRRPRPVVANVWEAVYFDHDLPRLLRLAELAAEVGVERLVLDDGWFGARRDDTAGLGDWVVSPAAWPGGLGPFADRVRALGMDFGLWFEPEMVNPDSELYRAHPDWVLAATGREPLRYRNQLVLDVGRPEVREHLFGQLHAVLSAYPISFVKWDHNRELPDAAARDLAGAAGARRQTLGFYALLDRLRAAHPGVEWESCASGGGRIDLGVLERVQRVWTSDMTDALARQSIQRWTGQLVPAEYLGAHVSAPVNHQSGRGIGLDFRVATAFFGDLGIEWDLAAATPVDRQRLAAWIAAYKEHRELLHGGRLLRVDTGTGDWLHGVLAPDRSRAVVGHFQLDEHVHDPLPLRVPGLDPERRYRAGQLGPDVQDWPGEGLVLTGAALAAVGLPAPARRPISALLVSLVATG